MGKLYTKMIQNLEKNGQNVCAQFCTFRSNLKELFRHSILGNNCRQTAV